jgi:tetratricopeptide (TPR) repeat protein
MRIWRGVTSIAAAAVLSACASKPVAPLTPAAERYAGFVEPVVPAELVRSSGAVDNARAWRLLQSGDLRNADRAVAAALRRAPGFYPAEAVAGYIELARQNESAAISRFNRALSHRADYVAALVGKGLALSGLKRDDDALETFLLALKADPSLADVRRQVQVIRLRVTQRDVTAARRAAAAGTFDEAAQAYSEAIRRSPDSAFLYRELALLERREGRTEEAIADFRRAIELDPGDAESLVDLADMLDARGDVEAAVKVYGDAIALAPDPTLLAKRDALRLRAEVARLPPEYRVIESALQITRGDLAALIGFRVPSLLQAGRLRDVGVMTDVRGHWAESWMRAAAAADVMDPYENHTFQPTGLIRRVDLAQTLTRLLNKIAAMAPMEAKRWENARGQFPDIAATHVAYPAASIVTAAGLMTTASDGAFEPTRLVTGAEATEAVNRVRVLADITSRSTDARP